MTQKEAVLRTLRRLGGLATLAQLNQHVFEEEDCQWGTRTPFASIRRIVQLHPALYKLRPGLYGLRELQAQHQQQGIWPETSEQPESAAAHDFSHSYYQGVLLTLGKLRQMETFCPAQDKNRLFGAQRLLEVRTLSELPPYSYPHIVKRSATVDVVWLNQRRLPAALFEVEHSTDIQNSLLKFNDLQDFNARMLIVAHSRRQAEYEQKLNYAAFEALRKPHKRVEFLSFDSLIQQYDRAVQAAQHEVLL